jgi:hypothetical protein
MTFLFIVIWLVSKQALSRLHSFAALPFSGAAPRPSEFVRAGTLLTSRELRQSKGTICMLARIL